MMPFETVFFAISFTIIMMIIILGIFGVLTFILEGIKFYRGIEKMKVKIGTIKELARCVKCGKPATQQINYGFLNLRYTKFCEKHGKEINNKLMEELGL